MLAAAAVGYGRFQITLEKDRVPIVGTGFSHARRKIPSATPARVGSADNLSQRLDRKSYGSTGIVDE